MINCIIIEDEPLAIEKLERYISKLPILNILKSFKSAIDSIQFIKTNDIDLIFLDIEMKELTGLQLLEAISINSKIIITTAYEKYAIKGFELQVSDYLLKPFTFERFVKACSKVLDELSKTSSGDSRIFIKTEYRLEGVDVSDILYVEGMGDYRRVVTEGKKIMTLETFQQLFHKLRPDIFFRVHKSYIVSLNKIKKIERNRISIADKLIPLSDTYRKEFYNAINK